MSSLAAFLFLASAALAQPQLPLPPPPPAVYPPSDQQIYITGSFLTDPLVTTALDYVNAVVPPALLNIRPSTQILFGNVTYNDNLSTNCYWGNGGSCKRETDTANFKADISACPGAGQWGLTFDDGPLVATTGLQSADLRSALNTAGVKATMFVVGSQINSFPQELLAHFNDGHEIAVHSWTHRPATNLTNAQLVAEIKYSERKIYEITGRIPVFFRPPYGDIDDRVRAIVSALGYRVVHWTTTPTSYDTQDTSATAANFATIQAAEIALTALPATNPGFISLQHEISNTTIALDLGMLNAMAARRAAGTLAITPQPVGQCMAIPAYRTVGTPYTATTVSSAPTAAATTARSTTNAAAPGAAPSSVGSVAGLVVGAAMALVATFGLAL
ncbi:hypothetical protein BJ742DRAFT_840295 [Cladochytrium replicatum]|nr:hypothetical protein BJ742DRAFT_840295 [Cladochytrium replicatum]